MTDSISKHDLIALLNLAKKLRKQENTRQAAIHLLVETAMVMSNRIHPLPLKDKTSQPPLLSKWIPEIVIDVEDVLEALSYYIKKNGNKNKMPLSLKRGLAKSLTAKGSLKLLESLHKQKRGLTLYDAMKILHPKVDSSSGENLNSFAQF